jgi:hypothetical protein
MHNLQNRIELRGREVGAISDFVVGSLVRGLHFQLTAQLTEYSEWFINFIPKGGLVSKYWLLRTQRLSIGGTLEEQMKTKNRVPVLRCFCHWVAGLKAAELYTKLSSV